MALEQTKKEINEENTTMSEDHGPTVVSWFGRACWPECSCGYAPRDNALLNAHRAEHGFKVVDVHGRLTKYPIEHSDV